MGHGHASKVEVTPITPFSFPSSHLVLRSSQKMDTDTYSQPRVNSARLGDFVGRSVRLMCKVERVRICFRFVLCRETRLADSIPVAHVFICNSKTQVTANSAIVRATDLGQIEVKVPMVRVLSLASWIMLQAPYVT